MDRLSMDLFWPMWTEFDCPKGLDEVEYWSRAVDDLSMIYSMWVYGQDNVTSCYVFLSANPFSSMFK
jgi:hypothetical protein